MPYYIFQWAKSDNRNIKSVKIIYLLNERRTVSFCTKHGTLIGEKYNNFATDETLVKKNFVQNIVLKFVKSPKLLKFQNISNQKATIVNYLII